MSTFCLLALPVSRLGVDVDSTCGEMDAEAGPLVMVSVSWPCPVVKNGFNGLSTQFPGAYPGACSVAGTSGSCRGADGPAHEGADCT